MECFRSPAVLVCLSVLNHEMLAVTSHSFVLMLCCVFLDCSTSISWGRTARIILHSKMLTKLRLRRWIIFLLFEIFYIRYMYSGLLWAHVSFFSPDVQAPVSRVFTPGHQAHVPFFVYAPGLPGTVCTEDNCKRSRIWLTQVSQVSLLLIGSSCTLWRTKSLSKKGKITANYKRFLPGKVIIFFPNRQTPNWIFCRLFLWRRRNKGVSPYWEGEGQVDSSFHNSWWGRREAVVK
jgi:hypothetical protein